MQYIAGLSRQQLQISSLLAKVAVNYFVRFMIFFADYISLETLDFTAKKKRTFYPLNILSQNFVISA